MQINIVRLLRTPHSERFILQKDTKDAAVLELHYMSDGKVSGTLIIFEGDGIKEKDVPALLTHIDEVLLPEVSIRENNLSFTVVIGKVIGSFTPYNGKE